MADYRVAFEAFNEAHRQGRLTQVGPDETEVRTAWQVPVFPMELRLIASDALYNLRSALDQAVCRRAVMAGNSPPKDTYFPHGEDQTKYASR
jgi:hypothetical protein